MGSAHLNAPIVPYEAQHLSGCTGKRKHRSLDAAYAKAKKLRLKNKLGGTKKPYHCVHCGQWHITSLGRIAAGGANSGADTIGRDVFAGRLQRAMLRRGANTRDVAAATRLSVEMVGRALNERHITEDTFKLLAQWIVSGGPELDIQQGSKE